MPRSRTDFTGSIAIPSTIIAARGSWCWRRYVAHQRIGIVSSIVSRLQLIEAFFQLAAMVVCRCRHLRSIPDQKWCRYNERRPRFPIMFNRHKPFIFNRSWIISVFLNRIKWLLFVLAAKGRPTPELIWLFDSLTHNLFRCSVGIFRLYLKAEISIRWFICRWKFREFWGLWTSAARFAIRIDSNRFDARIDSNRFTRPNRNSLNFDSAQHWLVFSCTCSF